MLRITNISKFEQIRKVLMIGAALIVVLGQLALATKPVQAAPQDNSTDSATTEQPVGQTSPPPANGVGLIADPVKDESKANEGIIIDPVRLPTNNNADAPKKEDEQQSGSEEDPSKDNNQGIIIDPVRDPGDNADAPNKNKDDDKGSTSNSKDDPILIHCSPGTGCSKEDSDAPKKKDDDDKSNSNEEPILIHCGLGTGCSNKEDASDQKATTASADAPGQSANTGELHGCPYDYEYNDAAGTCWPSDNDLGFYPGLTGDEPWPDSVGGYLSFGLDAVGDTTQLLGAGLMYGADQLGDILSDWGDQIGGPLGWGLQGLSGAVSFTGDMAGAIMEGAGQVVNGVGDAVGDAVDAVGDAAEDAWDEVSSWF